METGKWSNTIAFLAMVIVNALANLLPLGGKTTGQIANAYPSLFTPAGITFSIWGVIYLLMGAFILYQWGFFHSDEECDRTVKSISVLFIISCILNIAWLVSWHSDAIGLSVFFIAALLVSLILIQSRLRFKTAGKARRLMVNAGFDIYLGWILAATIANISVWLVKTGWGRFGLSEIFWTVIIILVGSAIGVCVVLVGQNRLAGCAVIWAYAGILTKHIDASGYGGKYPIIIGAVIVGIFAILASILLESTFYFLRVQEEAT